MSTETETETQNRSKTPEHSSSAETVVGFAILGLLVAGAVGISKAVNMTSGLDVLLCLLGSVAAFGMVIYIYFRKH
jgi:UDP-N-acetylmuramyl pentapeptide phosphotransferase/UDP-N-acetylglucosamine-1-phosphate transferase